jgi:hypothetical protein
MANTLILTNTQHLECVSLTASAVSNTLYTILNSNANYDRRIYGLAVTCNDANLQNIRLYLNDGVADYQVSFTALSAQSGGFGVAPLDLQGNSRIVPILGKRLDVMGVSYFNLPKGWSFRALYTGTQLGGIEKINFISQGELYDGVTHKYTSTAFQQTATFSSTTGSTEKDLLTSVAYDRRIYGIFAISTDSTARPITVYLKSGSNSYPLYTVNILANSGNTTTIKACDIFSDINAYSNAYFTKKYEPDGTYYFDLPAGWSITGNLTSPVAIGSLITIKTIGDSYE